MTRLPIVAIICTLIACEQPQPQVKPARNLAPSIERTIKLSNGKGDIHVVLLPGDAFDDKRCVLFVGETGNSSIACVGEQIRFED